MRRTLITIAGALALGFFATTSRAATIDLAIGDPYYVGTVIPGTGSPGQELAYIDYLITLQPEPAASSCGDGNDPCVVNYDSNDYSRARSGLTGSLPDPIVGSEIFLTDLIKVEGIEQNPPPVTDIDVTGATYILGKYDAANAGVLVWLVSDLESVTLPGEYDGHAISHYTIFAPVPDGGATLMLLGGVLVGLGALRRRFSA